jgi:recombination associated protein RdgC
VPGRKQLRELRDRVVEELLPRALVKRSRCHAIIDAENGWFFVDAASVSRGDEIIETLQKTLDGLALSRLKTSRSPVSAMTQWLAEGEVPGPFSIDRDAELRAPGAEKSSIRYVRHALDGDEVGEYLAAGKQVTRLALTWQDRISFVLDEETHIKRLVFNDLLKEQAAAGSEDEAGRIEADFAIMRAELGKFLPDLVAILGGEA